jgi:hypothetical protein
MEERGIFQKNLTSVSVTWGSSISPMSHVPALAFYQPAFILPQPHLQLSGFEQFACANFYRALSSSFPRWRLHGGRIHGLGQEI